MPFPDPDFRDEQGSSGKLVITHLADDRDSLDAFAVESSQPQPRPVAAHKQIELVPTPAERPEMEADLLGPQILARPQWAQRHEPFEQSRRYAQVVGLLSLAAIAVLVIVTLNLARAFVARQADAPALSRAERQELPSSSAAPREVSKPPTGTSSFPTAVADPADIRERESVRVPEQKPPALVAKSIEISKNVASPRAAPPPAVREPARAVVPESVARTQSQLEPVPAATAGIVRSGERNVDEPPAAVTLIDSAISAAASADVSTKAPGAALAAPPAEPVRVAPAAAPAAARVAAPREAVESILGRYVSAFSSLDARSAKAVWPSVNQRNLERAFENLEEQTFDLGACEIMVLPPRALAQCNGTARYTPKVGDRRERTQSRRWTFRLVQNGSDWSIDSVESR